MVRLFYYDMVIQQLEAMRTRHHEAVHHNTNAMKHVHNRRSGAAAANAHRHR